MDYYYGEMITLFFTTLANIILLLNIICIYIFFKVRKRCTFKWGHWIFITIIFFLISIIFWFFNKGLDVLYTLFFPVTILTIIVIFRVKMSNYTVVLLITPLYWRYVSYMISTFEYYGVPYTNLMFYLDIISILLIMFTIPIIMLIHIRNNQHV